MATTKEVSVLELAKGAIMEQVNNEMGRIMANIVDPNTEAKTARKLTITLVFKPDENREIINLAAQAKPNLAPIKPISTSLIVDTDGDGRPIAAELTRNDPTQIHVFEDQEPENNVVKLRSVQ